MLLFGEHSVLIGSDALAFPFRKYNMEWKPKNDEHPSWLEAYIQFLSANCNEFLDIHHLIQWQEKYTINTNIPIGYGLGSSGALTAAILDICGSKYKDLSTLMTHLGIMESFFHGKSSGFDPLISYLNKPILRTSDNIAVLEYKKYKLPVTGYLVDSNINRTGKSTIQTFLDESKKDPVLYGQLVQLNNQLIQAFLSQNNDQFKSLLVKVSEFQFDNMSYMIPDSLLSYWKVGLDTGDFLFKICGAGGGGYYYVFSDIEIKNTISYPIEEVELGIS